jgi:hypothetical protein
MKKCILFIKCLQPQNSTYHIFSSHLQQIHFRKQSIRKHTCELVLYIRELWSIITVKLGSSLCLNEMSTLRQDLNMKTLL